jgi:hypothetical protein
VGKRDGFELRFVESGEKTGRHAFGFLNQADYKVRFAERLKKSARDAENISFPCVT